MRRRVDAVALAVATRGASHSLANKGQHKGRDLAMWITFKTSAAPDVLMLDNLADYLLAIIGKRLGERGVIMHDELPVAIQKLESAIAVTNRNAPNTTATSTKANPATSRTRFPPAWRSALIRSSTCCASRIRRTATSCGAFERRAAFRESALKSAHKKPASSPMRVFSSYEYAAPYCAAADAGMLAPFFARGLRGFFLCSVIGGE